MINSIPCLVIEFDGSVGVVRQACAVDATCNGSIILNFIHHIRLASHISIIVNSVDLGVLSRLT